MCDHHRIRRVTLYDFNWCECLRCKHSWTEHPIHMTNDEYDSILLLVAAYLLAKSSSA